MQPLYILPIKTNKRKVFQQLLEECPPAAELSIKLAELIEQIDKNNWEKNYAST